MPEVYTECPPVAQLGHETAELAQQDAIPKGNVQGIQANAYGRLVPMLGH